MKERKLLYVIAALAMLQLCACSKDEPSREEEKRTIALMPVVDRGDVMTRASLYDSEEDLRADIFCTHAFLAGTSTPFFNSNVKYSSEDIDPSKHRWLFHDGSYYQSYYWPLENSVDFFAYAPVGSTYVTVDSAVNPPAFTSIMPLTSAGQEDMKEFTYAYTPDRDKSGGAVPLEFRHPFSGIIFKVARSQRDLTVKSIRIGGIKYSGTCSLTGEDLQTPSWSFGSSPDGTLDLTVGKIIPGVVNFGGELCGPYLVLPQTNAGAAAKTLSVECHWKGHDKDSDLEEDDTYTLTGKISNNWEPSKIYIYSLDLGNSREEILFKVSVTDWKYVYEHVFEIE